VVEPVLGLVVERERDLVELHHAVVVGDLREVDDDPRAFVGDDPEPAYGGDLRATTLAPEPAGSLDEPGELAQPVLGRSGRGRSGRARGVVGLVGSDLVGRGAVASSGGAVSRNQ